MTKQEKLIAALKLQGEKIVESQSIKYVTLTRSINGNSAKFYFVGCNGALRVGNTVSDSVSVTHLADRIIRKGQEMLNAKPNGLAVSIAAGIYPQDDGGHEI